MCGTFIDISGRKYGMLTVLHRAENRGRQTFWTCRCDCGTVKDIRGGDLKCGKIRSCGCIKSETAKNNTFVDITGMTFGRLTAIECVGSKNNRAQWLLQCSCGNMIIANGKDVRSGNTKSCGCQKKESAVTTPYIDGRSSERLNRVWYGMMARCYNPNTNSYKNYGGRGISICDEWHDYAKFRTWALENGYNPDAEFGECTIDRINNDGNYEPQNCRFVDSKVQAKNKRKGKKPSQRKPVIQFNILTGEKVERFESITDAAEKTGADASSIVSCCKGKSKTCLGFGWKYAIKEET